MFLLEISLWCGELDVSLFGVFSQVSLSILHILLCVSNYATYCNKQIYSGKPTDEIFKQLCNHN